MSNHSGEMVREGAMHMSRSRGMGSGVLLVLLGVWGAIIPFVGPLFSFAYSPDSAWTWTAARGWLSVLPGVVVIVGGLLMIASRNRAVAVAGSWLAALAGAWFVVGPVLAGPWGIGDVGAPMAGGSGMRALEELAFFSLLGVVIVFLAALTQGRVSVRRVYPHGAAHRDASAEHAVPGGAQSAESGAIRMPGSAGAAPGPGAAGAYGFGGGSEGLPASGG